MKYDYDVAVIGGGAAGLTSAGMAASFGAKTIMIEAKRLGGDCTWYGCVPSKALLKAAKVVHTVRTAGKFGIKANIENVNLKEVLKVVHKIQDDVYNVADDPAIYEKMGVEVINGTAGFVDKRSIEIESSDGKIRKITSKYFVIATGSAPKIPTIDGIYDVPFLTNETIFTSEELPSKMVIIGGGPIGIEMSQAFRRFGSEVSIIDLAESILGKDDPELTSVLKEKLLEEGINIYHNSSIQKVGQTETGIKVIVKNNKSNEEFELECDKLLVSAGRKANINSLNLEAAGIESNKRGIVINAKCRTTQSNIYACGDVAGTFQFTHYAEHMAKVAVSNMLLKLPFKIDKENVPWVTYTDPEIAHVGLTESELQKKNIKYEIYRFPYSKIDRAVTESENHGFIKVLAANRSGKIYGADIVGHDAGEMISEFSLAKRNGVTLRKMADTIHPYPTYGLGNRRAADQWYVRKQSRLVVRILQILFGYKGILPDTSDPLRIV